MLEVKAQGDERYEQGGLSSFASHKFGGLTRNERRKTVLRAFNTGVEKNMNVRGG